MELTAAKSPQNRASPVMWKECMSPWVPMTKVPNKDSPMAASSSPLGSRSSRMHTTARIRIGDRYWSTVAVPALDAWIAIKYVNWQKVMPKIANASKWMVSLFFRNALRFSLP